MTRLTRALPCAALLLFFAPSSAGAVVITTGTLTDASGTPTGGQVRVYGWVFPKQGQTLKNPLLGTATAGPDGRFTVTGTDDNALTRLAARRKGFVDFTVVGDTGTYTGNWGFTGFVDGPAGAARVSTAHTSVPDITIKAVNRTAFAHAAQYGQCDMNMHTRALGSMRKMTVVGELNNAYNDGTVGTFTYSREHTAETTIGAAQQLENGAWSISAEYAITNAGTIKFPPFKRRLSRKMRSMFEYTKYEVQASSCAVWEPYIRATSWIGDYDISVKQNGLDKCDAKYLHGYSSGGGWSRNSGNAVTYTQAVEAFGVNLTARSGFSKNVTLEYDWNGPARKQHYICGEDGKSSPFTSGRVFTGSRK
jgi:hypothetical protein